VVLPLSLFCVENHVCLSHGVQVAGAAWRAATRIVAGVGDLVWRTKDGQAQVRYSVVGRLGGRVTSCAVCTVHEETRSVGFLVESQNQGRWFVRGFASKPLGRFLPIWPQNLCRRFLPVWPQNWLLRVSRFGTQNQQLQFGDLDQEITAMISWFGPQNEAGYGLSVAPQNRREDEDDAGHTLRSDGLLHMEASRPRVSQYGLKTSGGVTAGGARDTITEVT
jgi:hypothetical protein